MAPPMFHVCAVIQSKLSANHVFFRWYLGHVEPEPLPTFVSHIGDVMIYFKLQVCDQLEHHSEWALTIIITQQKSYISRIHVRF